MVRQNGTVVVAMSGGVDSSVAAALLVEQGYTVIGVTMKLWDFDETGGNVNRESGCCSIDSFDDARSVSASLGIPYYVLDYHQDFQETVINDFIGEYLDGRTPNPCVLCNTKIKWERLFDTAKELGADYLATGHYGKITFDSTTKRYAVARGIDTQKDQSYALWGLTQQSMAHTILPLGDLTKTRVREIAEQYNLRTAKKSESQEICFVTDNNYQRFINEKLEKRNQTIPQGEIIMESSNQILGTHKGYPFYTIGQRSGLGISLGVPIYVTRLEPETNRVYVGKNDDLLRNGLVAKKVNFQSVSQIEEPIPVTVKIRYNDRGSSGMVRQMDSDTVEIKFNKPQRAVTPGQSVVFYQQDIIVGGGIIQQDLR